MNKTLSILRVVMTLAPHLWDIVKAAETHLPDSAGKVKLEAVRAQVEHAFKAVQGASVTFSQVWPSLEPIVTGIVDSLNASGAFTHKVNITRATTAIDAIGGALGGYGAGVFTPQVK